MFEELRHSTKLPYLRNERCTTVLNVIAVCPQKIMGVENDPIVFWNPAKFFRGNRTVKHWGVYLSRALYGALQKEWMIFFWIPGRNINLFETSLKELCWAKRITNSRDIFSANPVNPVDWWVCTFQNTTFIPSLGGLGVLLTKLFSRIVTDLKKSSHGHHLSPCHLNNEEIQLHVFANFSPGKGWQHFCVFYCHELSGQNHIAKMEMHEIQCKSRNIRMGDDQLWLFCPKKIMSKKMFQNKSGQILVAQSKMC